MAPKSKTSRSGYVATVGLGTRRLARAGGYTSAPEDEHTTVVRDARPHVTAEVTKPKVGLFANLSAVELDRVRATMVPLGAEGRPAKPRARSKG